MFQRHWASMYSCSALRAVWSLRIPDRIPRSFRPATAESSTAASSPMLWAPAVWVEADTGHLPLTSTRPPLSSLRCRASFSAFASTNSLVYLAFALLYRSLLLSMNPSPSLHRLAITRLGAASPLLHCPSTAVYPLLLHSFILAWG